MKKIEGIPNYVIFFDHVRVDPFVKGFSTSLSNDGSIGRADIEMLYLPELHKASRSEDVFDNMTNVKIFVKNIVNDKYTSVFDGNIRAKSVSQTPHGSSVSYVAVAHLELLTKTISPIAIPMEDKFGGTTWFRLQSQAINTDAISSVESQATHSFKGKNISQIFNFINDQTLSANGVFKDTEGVLHWNGITERVKIMGDINENVRHLDALDLRINPNALIAENMYVLLNDILQRMMFEFYQDRDGTICIKPPFWNESVPMNHVIDPSIIMGYTEHTAWESTYSRVVTTGGIANYENQATQTVPGQDVLTPMGVYVGDMNSSGRWATLQEKNVGPLLNPTEYERRYGIAVFENMQTLIKNHNATVYGAESAKEVLQQYCTFMFNMLNSMARTASVQLVGAPWLRPGMNAWLDPTRCDKVYYVASVSHTGDPQSGVYTSVQLLHGRDSEAFFSGDSNMFGALSMTSKDNIFINSIDQDYTPEARGAAVNRSNYKQVREDCINFHSSDNDGIIKANKNPYLKRLYGKSGRNDYGFSDFTSDTIKQKFPGLNQNRVTLADYLFTDDYTIQQLSAILSFMYSRAPQVVVNRCKKIASAVEPAKKQVYKRYVSETFKR